MCHDLGETSIIVYDEITPRVLIIIGNLETGASDKKLDQLIWFCVIITTIWCRTFIHIS